jgi:L-threonylcarbamoyladenylate synthase
LLVDKFWPGPLTLIFEKQDNVPLSVTAGLDTVAVRFPSNPVAQELIALSTGFVAAPSANLSGSPSPTVYKHVFDDMNGRVDYIIDGEGCEIGLESTVVDVTGTYPVVLRPGGITLAMLKDVVPETIMDSKIFQFVDKPKCPGMKYTHYSPKADVIVVSGDKESRRKYIQNEILNKESVGVLSFDGNVYENADCVISAGDDMHSYAKTLFYNLRLFDEHNIKTVYAEFRDQDGIGVAVKNRLFKSAGFNIVNV